MPDRLEILLDDAGIGALVHELHRRATAPTQERRLLIGIAGIAGSGKSTLAERLVTGVNEKQPGLAVFMPMDGFHRRNAELERLGLIQRKGSPPSYDAEAYVATLARFRDPAETGTFPIYDRGVHEPVDSPEAIDAGVKLIVTEGQFLLLRDAPWNRLADVLDKTWMIEMSREQARQWLRQRDLSVGRDEAEAQRKFEQNDKLNTDIVLSNSRDPDRVLRHPELS